MQLEKDFVDYFSISGDDVTLYYHNSINSYTL